MSIVVLEKSVSSTRTLVLVAKCLQNLANLISFGGKVGRVIVLEFALGDVALVRRKSTCGKSILSLRKTRRNWLHLLMNYRWEN